MTRQDEETTVEQAVREYIFQRHKFPQLTDIAEATSLSKSRCKDLCDSLIHKKRLYVVFEGSTMPRVVVPYDMMQEMLRYQPLPAWVEKYGFAQRIAKEKQIAGLRAEIDEYAKLERLLFGTDVPLEEAVVDALSFLGFSNVRHIRDDLNNPDITLRHEDKLVVIEVQGTTKAADKDKVQQLAGWQQQVLVQNDLRADQIAAFLVVNHYREVDPEKREGPLTMHARELMKLYQLRFFTTVFLYDIVKKTKTGGLAKTTALARIWQGQAL